MRKFSTSFRLAGDGSADGEVVAESDAGAQAVIAWIDKLKEALHANGRQNDLEIAASKLDHGAVRLAMDSQLGVDLYSITMANFPGMPAKVVAANKLKSVQTGMKQEELLALLGKPLSVSSIQGLERPRETWTYQIAFGKRVTVRLDDGVVTAPPAR